jgi:hypothetical protein
VERRIILLNIREICYEDVNYIELAQGRVQCQDFTIIIEETSVS